MKLLRIGVVLFVVGVSLLVAAQLRARSVWGGGTGGGGIQGPFLLEPRETIIVLEDLSSQNVTVTVVPAQAWLGTQDPSSGLGSAPLNVSEVTPVFNVSGIMNLDRVIFTMPSRGMYYILVLTSAGKPVDSVDLVVEQEGVAEDLLTISAITLGVGVAIIIVDRVRSLKHHGH
jgi:hypothetical protein